MNRLKYILSLLSAFLFCVPSFAQMTNDPTTWKYELKKKSATEYQLVFHLELKEGWHIWSLHPGGDGYEIAPSFVFDKNPKVKLKGAVAEKGKPVTTKMEGIDGKVVYFSGKVDYVQDVTITGNTRITGKHTYQVCNNSMCLPPKDKDFVFDIKQ
jgi:DsbC/DsbD-like thiol-disulfide interchange protein